MILPGLTAIVIILGLAMRSKSKVFGLVAAAAAGFLSAFNTSSGDYLNYVRIYRDVIADYSGADVEFGWKALCWLGGMLGIPYEVFFGIVVFAVLCLLNRCLSKTDSTTSVVWSLLLLFPLFLNLVQIRQFIASVIFLYGVAIASARDDRFPWPVLVSIGVSFLFHKSAAVLLLPLLLGWLYANRPKLVPLVGVAVAAGGYCFRDTIYDYLIANTYELATMRLSAAVDLPVLLGLLAEAVLIEYMAVRELRTCRPGEVGHKVASFARMLNWSIVCLLPLICFSGGRLTRLQFYKYPLNYVLFSRFALKGLPVASRPWMDVAFIIVYVLYVIARSLILNASDWQYYGGSFLWF